MVRQPRTEPSCFAISPGRGDRAELNRKLPRLVEGGLRQFLLREKQLADAPRRRLARWVAPFCRELGLILWISEDAELAAEVHAAGVHLSEGSPAPSRIQKQWGESLALGVSLHANSHRSREEISRCEHAFLSPLFPVPKSSTALGLEGFERAAREIPVRVYALGGIAEHRVVELARSQIRNLAAIRLFFDAVNPEETVRSVLQQLRGEEGTP